jgi:hypothetical protein
MTTTNSGQPMLFAEQLAKMSDTDVEALYRQHIVGDEYNNTLRPHANSWLSLEECNALMREYKQREKVQRERRSKAWNKEWDERDEIEKKHEQFRQQLRKHSDDELTRMNMTVTTAYELTAIRAEQRRRQKATERKEREQAASPARAMARAMSCEALLAWDAMGASEKEFEQIMLEIKRRIKQFEKKHDEVRRAFYSGHPMHTVKPAAQTQLAPPEEEPDAESTTTPPTGRRGNRNPKEVSDER